jgi:UDP-N-acetyl-D-galactosamine dehydrogenase
VILAGRRINDGMGKFIAEQTVKQMIRSGASVKGSHVNVLGLTFKEDCPDLRNSRVIDVIRELQSFGTEVHVHDPMADGAEAHHEYGVELTSWDALPRADALVVAVAHKDYMTMPAEAFAQKVVSAGTVVDVKCRLHAEKLKALGLNVWRL